MTLSSFHAFLRVSSARLQLVVGCTCVLRRLITVELGFVIELHAACRYLWKRHQVLVNVIVTARRSIARKKKKIACLPFYLFFFSAIIFVLPHSISNNEFLSPRCTKVKLFLIFFFKRYEISCSLYKKSFCRKKLFFFQNSIELNR